MLVSCQYGQYNLTFRALALRQRETKGQCSKRQTILSALAVHRPFYISICIFIQTSIYRRVTKHFATKNLDYPTVNSQSVSPEIIRLRVRFQSGGSLSLSSKQFNINLPSCKSFSYIQEIILHRHYHLINVYLHDTRISYT